jgi:S1-C subfamily serine protease
MRQYLTIAFFLLTTSFFSQSTSWDENKLKEHWGKNGADEIEGIYMRTTKIEHFHRNRLDGSANVPQKDKYFIVKQDKNYLFYSKTDGFNGTMNRVYNSNKFFLSINCKHFVEKRFTSETVPLIFKNGSDLVIDNFRINLDADEYVVFNDIFSMVWKPEIEIKKDVKVSGTGFAINSNGLIVTNFHVIEGAKSIRISGINSDFNKSYQARVLVSDKNNDLALIQIDDYSFTSLGTIPYTIKTSLAGVGENIFVLGYPLRASMGNEIKLTNGIVSSRSGFQGDITSYQISAPIQPGNSGGPLFDNQGNLIGIINAKHLGAENASYSIKASYLMNLIELLPNPPKLQSVNLLIGKSLTQQVEIAKKFIYIIETE